MAYVVRMPQLNLEMVDGQLIEWYVAEGEPVEADTELFQIETDKAVQDIEAREDGVLRRRYVEAGETVETGTPLGIVAEESADISALEREVAEETDPTPDAHESSQESEPDRGGGTDSDRERIRASPRARQLADELDVDLSELATESSDGPITEADVEAAAGAGEPEPTVRQIDGMRKTIADRLHRSYREAVHVTLQRTVDADALVETVRSIEPGEQPDAVSFVDLLLSDLSDALAEHPGFNGFVAEERHELVPAHRIAVAVDVEDGLVTPVLPDIRELSIHEIATERRELTARAAAGNLSPDDLDGGTFTVSNLGVFGVESFDPIINPPQVAILGVGALDERPSGIVDGELAFKQVLPLSLTFDHRVVDGADAARFLETLADRLETAEPARYIEDE